jgi:hypothetical protein
MIAVLPFADNLRMFIEGKSYFSLEGEPGPFKNDLWTELDAHVSGVREDQAVAASAD